MTTQQTVTSTCSTSKTPNLSDNEEERLLKLRLMDEKAKESKEGKKSDVNDTEGGSNTVTKLMGYDWTCLDFVIVMFYTLSALSFARAFSSVMLLLPHSHGLFYIFLGIYWFICIYPTYKFFSNLNVRGAVLVHMFINLISGGAILIIVGMTFWNSRYIISIQFISIIVLSLFPFKVIQTRAIGKLSAKYSMEFSEKCVNATVKTYKSAAGFISDKMG